MTAPGEHFRGCHPEHDRDQREPDRLPEPGEGQSCWHCGTPTPQGCNCDECWDEADEIPPAAAYHCPLCRRWWATMRLVITRITFGAEA